MKITPRQIDEHNQTAKKFHEDSYSYLADQLTKK